MTAAELAAGLGAKKLSDGWMAQCPAHEDKTPSLHINERNGRVLVYCHGGCSQAAVIRKLAEMKLWESETLTPEEIEKRKLQRHYQEQIRIANARKAAALDAAKLQALEREDWEAWERICKQQYRFTKAAAR